MIPKLLEVLDSVTLVSPVTGVQRQLVTLNGREIYAVCFNHNNHSIYTTGQYFFSEAASKAFFDLHIIEADLAKGLDPAQAAEYAKFKPLRLEEMRDQLPR